VAANVASLGGRAGLVGLVGDDVGATLLDALLAERGVRSLVVRDGARTTTHKTRFVARGQQIVRIDQESRGVPAGELRDRLVAAVRAAVSGADAVVLSDYAKGVISAEVVAATIDAARAKGVPVVADPKRRDLGFYRGVTVVTPNLNELEVATGLPGHNDDEVAAAGAEVLPTLGGGALLVTRGADGMTLFEPNASAFHVRAAKKSVFDVTGAGDTVVATIALALAGGASLRDAMVLASAAAGVVVSKEGTASVSKHELMLALEDAGEGA
jgi:D-beta-D-heptose 7-phosphate kinase/D-beta-D-heptose 1-phosphate adenosyltransferase